MRDFWWVRGNTVGWCLQFEDYRDMEFKAFQSYSHPCLPFLGVPFYCTCSSHQHPLAQDSRMDGSSTVSLENTPVGTTSARKGAAALPKNPRNSIPPINLRSAIIITPPPNPKLWQKLRERTHKLLIPARPVGKPPGVLQSLKSIVCASCRWFQNSTFGSLSISAF